MSLSNIFGAAAIGLLISSLFLYGKWQSALVEVESMKAQVATLEQVNEQNQQTINGMQILANKNADIIANMGERNEQIMRNAENATTELNNLRLTEAEAALAEPFERGNAARDRILDQLMRFSGDVQSPDDSGNAPAGNTEGAASPEPG